MVGRLRSKVAALAVTVLLVVAGCTSSNDGAAGTTSGGPAGSEAGAASQTPDRGEVVLVTHDSFTMDDALKQQFEQSTGLTLTVLAQGDAGAMVNQLVLTQSNPLGDAVFGIDNTFASRATDANVLARYESPDLPAGAEQYAIGDGDRLTPIDYGDVCVNADREFFAARGLPVPTRFEELTSPLYRDMLVVPSPATSSPGLAFLLATIAHFNPEVSRDYWRALKTNGVKVTSGWTDAYTVDFSGSSGKGDRPLVVSYASSPAFEVQEGDTEAPTVALLDTCFRQVEYAGVLNGAKNPEGAQQLVDFMLSQDFQAALPESMYVYPVDDSVALPPNWEKFAPAAEDPLTIDSEIIAAGRDLWISQWTDLMEG